MVEILHKNKIKIAIISLILVFIVFTYYTSIYFTFDNINENKTVILNFINQNYVYSIVIILSLSIFFINSPIPMSALFMILNGFLFGFYVGSILNLVSVTFASYVGFLFSRYVFKNDFEEKYKNKFKETKFEIEKHGFYYFLSVRFIFIIPNFLINIFGGISKISNKSFLLSTFLGSILFSLVYANVGYQLKLINSILDVFNLDLLFTLLFFACMSLLPIILEKHTKKII